MSRWTGYWRVALLMFAIAFVPQAVFADYAVQVGAFKDLDRARKLASRVREAGWPVEVRSPLPGSRLLRVWAGPVASREEAMALQEALRPFSSDAFIVRLESAPTPASPGTGAPPAVSPETGLRTSGGETPEGVVPLPGTDTDAGEAAAGEAAAGEAAGGEGMDALFGLEEPPESVDAGAAGMDALFGMAGEEEAAVAGGRGIGGYLQSEAAYTFADDPHWSKFRNLAEVHGQGSWGEGNGWWLGVRAWFDPVYAVGDYYPDAVRQDQGFEADIREAYLDFSAGDWDFRLGRQHIIWGEMVGLFFADVVSAKDLREFVLVDFDYLRIPQWATLGEYFKGDFHAEAVWIPVMSYNKVGKYGADFFPALVVPRGYGLEVADDRRPDDTLENSGYGLRLSYLWSGWDVSGFYFSSPDLKAAYARTTVGGSAPLVRYTPVHERVARMGGTFAKDVGAALVKGELVYTMDRPFSVLRLSEPDGLVPLDLVDYVVGLEFTTEQSVRLNFQFFGRYFTRYDADVVPDRHETGVSALISREFPRLRLEPEVLLIHSLNRPDWLLSAKLAWRLDEAWRLRFGVDLLQGPGDGLFGQYADKDRVFGELRYSF